MKIYIKKYINKYINNPLNHKNPTRNCLQEFTMNLLTKQPLSFSRISFEFI